MKKAVLGLCLLAITSVPIKAQVKIADNPTNIDSSSLLEMESTTKGLLIPRMTTTQRNAIVLPAEGLLIFNTTDSLFNFYKSGWSTLGNRGIARYISINDSALITTTSTTDVAATGITLTPGAGTYAVRFNGQYAILPENPTTQAVLDLRTAFNQLMATTNTNTSHAPAFGGGETLTTGVYAIAGAGSAAGNLTLDTGGNPNAVFIFKFGGAFSTGAGITIILTNGASACNILDISRCYGCGRNKYNKRNAACR